MDVDFELDLSYEDEKLLIESLRKYAPSAIVSLPHRKGLTWNQHDRVVGVGDVKTTLRDSMKLLGHDPGRFVQRENDMFMTRCKDCDLVVAIRPDEERPGQYEYTEIDYLWVCNANIEESVAV